VQHRRVDPSRLVLADDAVDECGGDGDVVRDADCGDAGEQRNGDVDEDCLADADRAADCEDAQGEPSPVEDLASRAQSVDVQRGPIGRRDDEDDRRCGLLVGIAQFRDLDAEVGETDADVIRRREPAVVPKT
jgi:hypothetical protein